MQDNTVHAMATVASEKPAEAGVGIPPSATVAVAAIAAASPTARSPRQRILAAAVHCFARSGFHGTSMQEICAAAAMSPGALYRHFPSKDAIIEAIAAEEREMSGRFLEKIAVDRQVLDTLFDTGLARMRELGQTDWGGLCAEVLAEARRNPRIRAIFDDNYQEARRAIRSALERARDNGEVDASIDLDVVVAMLMAMGDGLMARMSFDPEMTPDRIDPSLRILIRRMLAPQPGG